MKSTFRAVLIAIAVLWAIPASAQTPAPTIPSGPMVNSWYVGANTGTAVVEKFGNATGLDGGIRTFWNLDVVGEVLWAQNVVSRRQIDRVGTIARHIGQTQGGEGNGELKVPMSYGGLGVRWVFEQQGFMKPYVLVTVGIAKTELKPTVKLKGIDITDTLTSYGVTLGSDLIGTSKEAAGVFGVGILMKMGRSWYVDAGARLTSIKGEDQRTNVARLVLGGGYRY